MSSKLETITTCLTLASKTGVVTGSLFIAFKLQQSTKALRAQVYIATEGSDPISTDNYLTIQ